MSQSRAFLDLPLSYPGYHQPMKKCSVILMLLLLVTSCGANGASVPQLPRRPIGVAHPYWLISLNAINLLEKNGASASLITTLFNTNHSYIIIGPRQTDPFPLSIPVANFTSYRDIPASHTLGMASAFSRNLLPQGIKAISYDDENWRFTAAGEIAHPVDATALASDLAHQHGFQFISSPGMDLGTSATGNIQALPMSYASFVKDGYLNIAHYDDLFELQLENIETKTNYVTLAQQAKNRIKAINPKIILLLQLTSNPNHQSLRAEDLMNDYHASKGFIDGYALTIPDSVDICPACGPPNVQTMLTFLKALEQE